MKKNSLILFHLNLLFSSIPIKDYQLIISQCYWRLSGLINSGIKFSIEANARTLEIISELDPGFIEFLKVNLSQKKIDFIGSGYAQMIYPTAPYHINLCNLEEGRKVYRKLINHNPRIALVNEMVFSRSMISLFKDAGYDCIVIDIDNASKALNKSKSELYKIHSLQGDGDNSINIIWSDSMLFQSFQRVIFNEISQDSYFHRLDRHLVSNNPEYTPIYTNDAEIFNYRPGRFLAESNIQSDEWKTIEGLLQKMVLKNWNFYTLSEISNDSSRKSNKKTVLKYQPKISQAVIVKKQSKYNISRWSVTGKEDQFLNTICYKLSSKKYFNKLNSEHKRFLLRLWGSDLRTHINAHKLSQEKKLIKSLQQFLKLPNITHKISQEKIGKEYFKTNDYFQFFEDEISFVSDQVKATFQVNKGLALTSLQFKNQDECITSFSNDYFADIDHGVDFFSGGILIEIPNKKLRITDYKMPNKIKFYKDSNTRSIKSYFDLGYIELIKIITFHLNGSLKYKYYLKASDRLDSSIRIGNLIFKRYEEDKFEYASSIGGKEEELFPMDDFFDHSRRISMIVSSESGLPATEGQIKVSSDHYSFRILLNHQKSFSLPMLINKKIEDKLFTRLIFSLSEVDDNSINKVIPNYFEFEIKPDKSFKK
jgi:hypothetical protein